MKVNACLINSYAQQLCTGIKFWVICDVYTFGIVNSQTTILKLQLLIFTTRCIMSKLKLYMYKNWQITLLNTWYIKCIYYYCTSIVYSVHCEWITCTLYFECTHTNVLHVHSIPLSDIFTHVYTVLLRYRKFYIMSWLFISHITI